MNSQVRLEWSLLMLRVSVFIVMLAWTFDKLVRPQHGAAIFEKFYFVSGVPQWFVLALGVAQLVLMIAFLVGWQRRWTYGIVFVLHAFSTLSSLRQYLAPFEASNLLFYAAWPMLAACATLYLMRDNDKKFTVGH